MIKNRKGYLLIEIILASVIAFGIAYFLLKLTFKIKNNNDDMEVNTILTTDNAIITNKLMKYFIEEGSEFDCSSFNVDSNNSTITYKNTLIDKVSEYAVVGAKKCEVTDDYAHINIPISVSQQSEKNYDVDIFYRINKIENICYDDLISDQTSFFEYTGEYELIDDCQDNGTGVCTINGSSPCDWKIKFLSSGDLILKYITWNIDVFLVGGGAAGNYNYICASDRNSCPTSNGSKGGTGGSSFTKLKMEVNFGNYQIQIGTGGKSEFIKEGKKIVSDLFYGNPSKAFGLSSDDENSIPGGVGGVGGTANSCKRPECSSASSGNNGEDGKFEFGINSNDLYGGGGGGGGGGADYTHYDGRWGNISRSGGSGGKGGGGKGAFGTDSNGTNGVSNTGGGGGGGGRQKGGDGGSGIVIIRNTRADR